MHTVQVCETLQEIGKRKFTTKSNGRGGPPEPQKIVAEDENEEDDEDDEFSSGVSDDHYTSHTAVGAQRWCAERLEPKWLVKQRLIGV